MKKKIIILFLIFTFIIFSGFGCKCVSGEMAEKMKPVTLRYWRVFDEKDAFDDLIAAYKILHPFVNIEYKKLRYEEYEKELIEAFAFKKGPDLFSIHNTWMKKYQNNGLISPMPAQITMAYPVEKGSIKKEIIPELRTTNSISIKEIERQFIDVVHDDIIINYTPEGGQVKKEGVFGLPLSVDTLVMFYNRSLFNNAGITNPPQYWNREFQQNIKKLSKQNNKGEIIQSGVALGGGFNIERSSDILSLLMMQNGTEMMSERGIVNFNKKADDTSANQNPGLEALRFYTDFANPAKEVYSWNSSLENSLELFLQNKLAIMFGYAYMLPDIKTRAPKLNFSVTSVPQIENSPQSVNFANYWVEVVSSESPKKEVAWDFIQFITKAEQVGKYLDKTKKPTALRSLIEDQTFDKEIGVFAEQLLTAKSWYKGHDAIATENIMKEMIEETVVNFEAIKDALRLGAGKIQQTVNN